MFKQSYYVFPARGIKETLPPGEGKRYVLKIRDMPEEEKPREKLLAHGPDALSTTELLAVFLGTGTKKEEVLAMSSRIIKDYGEGGLMSQKNPRLLSSDLDIPLGKSMQIVACSELGRRFFHRNNGTLPTIRTAKEVFQYASSMRNLTKEHLRGIYLNARYKVIHDEIISIGTVDGSLIHPREVFKPAIEHSAVALILVHNHPSGVTDASAADVEITKQLIQAGKIIGVDLIDHVIVTEDSFGSVPAQYNL